MSTSRKTIVALVVVVGCASSGPPPITPVPVIATSPAPTRPAQPSRPAAVPRSLDSTTAGVRDAGLATIRVLLSVSAADTRVSSPGGMIFSDRNGEFIARAGRSDVWRIQHDGRRVRTVGPDGLATAWIDGPVNAHALDESLISVAVKPYRGDLAFVGTDSGLAVVNVASIDDYLRGVVPLEIGTRAASDSAAVEAQAVTARSYAYIHLADPGIRFYDVTAGTQDQVYGGVAAETAVSSEAVETTRTLVLKYAGRVVNAPYFSACGGSTAAASEVWHSNDEPYLQRVSDQIPGTGRYYCDIAPRFRWTTTLEGSQLNAAVAQYLANYTSVPGRRPGIVHDVAIASHTPSGRVGTLIVTTERGNFTLRGNDIRSVLRKPGGEILNSTYFSVQTVQAPDGTVARLLIDGMGYGHGVGMCQWGAIGRARAGQDFRMILATYYPGTSVGPAS